MNSVLKMSLISGILSLSACAGQVPPVVPRPHFLDTQLGELREYTFTKSYDLKGPTAIHEITWGKNSYGNGFFCVPAGEARQFKDWAIKQANQCKK